MVTTSGQEEEAITRLSRVGNIDYLKGGFETSKQAGKEIDYISRLSAQEFKKINTTNILHYLL